MAGASWEYLDDGEVERAAVGEMQEDGGRGRIFMDHRVAPEFGPAGHGFDGVVDIGVDPGVEHGLERAEELEGGCHGPRITQRWVIYKRLFCGIRLGGDGEMAGIGDGWEAVGAGDGEDAGERQVAGLDHPRQRGTGL